LLKPLLVVGFLFTAMPSYAAQQWSGFRTITSLYPNAGGFSFNLDGTPPGTVCGGNRFFIVTSAPNYAVIVSSLVTAFAGQMKVTVNYDDTTLANCDIVINRAIIQP